MVGVALRLPVECGFLVLQFSLSLNYFLVRWLGSVHEAASDVPYSGISLRVKNFAESKQRLPEF